jgi:D-alanyl-D-alanine carboxypeptidase/D-alanyl-D-alanine-endopeptidase (penicillin-binding protein 4)
MMSRRRVGVVFLGGVLTALVVVGATLGIHQVTDSDSAPGTDAALQRREVTPVSPRHTTTTTTTEPACVPDPTLAQPALPAPDDLAFAGTKFAADPRVAGHEVSASVWIDGYGETLVLNPDLPLAPASNQKLFTAMGALAVLGPDATLTTELRLTRTGDLVIVPGGDPTLTSTGPHSLAALAQQAADAGVQTVTGALFVDESRHDPARRAPGWQDWQIPTYTGPLSAFMVDDNRWRSDPAFLADPALANAERLRDALASFGITIAGGTGYGGAEADARVVATLVSAPIGQLVHDMLQRSDNQIADLLLEEIGFSASGVGSLTNGAAAINAALEPLCVPIRGATDDGSGLSRADRRSAREWRQLLQAARGTPWGPTLAADLPLAGRSGTLIARMRGTAAEGNVHAKTGTIIGGAALSGYGTTASGRAFVFSAIVNGPGTEHAAGAIDSLVAAIAGIRT